MPNQTGCIRCGSMTLQFRRGDEGVEVLEWLDFPGYGGGYGDVAKRIPLGVWMLDSSKTIVDFLKKIDGKLPDDTLDWQVDEVRYTNYIKLYGPRAMLFSETETACEMPIQLGITREDWMDKYTETYSGDKIYSPDPIMLLATARKHWIDGGGVVLHGRNGERFRIGGKIDIPGGGVEIGGKKITSFDDLDKYFEELRKSRERK